jgi:hypothetical protein
MKYTDLIYIKRTERIYFWIDGNRIVFGITLIIE